MKISQLLDRLRDRCHGLVEISHSFESGAVGPYPAAVVSPLKVEATPPMFTNIPLQDVRAVYGVFIFLDAQMDDAVGAGQADVLDDLRAEVRVALTNWTPDDSEFQPLIYMGGELSPLGNGLFAWREDFGTSYEIGR